MLDEILQDSWTYQEIRQKGVEQANLKWLASQRAFLISAVESRFPTLHLLATEKSQQVRDPEVLLQASARLFNAHTQADAEAILKDLPETTEPLP